MCMELPIIIYTGGIVEYNLQYVLRFLDRLFISIPAKSYSVKCLINLIILLRKKEIFRYYEHAFHLVSIYNSAISLYKQYWQQGRVTTCPLR